MDRIIQGISLHVIPEEINKKTNFYQIAIIIPLSILRNLISRQVTTIWYSLPPQLTTSPFVVYKMSFHTDYFSYK